MILRIKRTFPTVIYGLIRKGNHIIERNREMQKLSLNPGRVNDVIDVVNVERFFVQLNRKEMKQLFLIASALVFSLGVSAQNSTPMANKKQVRQQVRIAEGVASGELTKAERRGLKAQQRNIRRTKQRAKADGVVTPGERVLIHKKQRRADRSIRRQKNDAQSRN